ncbi:MAG: Holliday junction resolvase RuvX [Candidatus Midichloria sp.]|uniref:Holliday junction resolvase RuvX n=1 Tax=Hyalomma marginatum TaxID=34627 RepID=A0A8S4C4X8_9ACAR|nr:Holliday junction resolvase RuvX [Hyalomma marginatum]CAG7594818.1 Holliday junction resolvase RuvX [Hyalomma marginatum]
MQQIKTPIEDLLKKLKANPNIKFLCLDVGKKKIGIASGCFNLAISIPYKVMQHQGREKNVNTIIDICKEIGAENIVIGIPLQNSELETSAQYIVKFAKELSRSKAKIYFQDESFSSCLAADLLQDTGLSRKKKDSVEDAVAASIILTNFFHRIKNFIST